VKDDASVYKGKVSYGIRNTHHTTQHSTYTLLPRGVAQIKKFNHYSAVVSALTLSSADM